MDFTYDDDQEQLRALAQRATATAAATKSDAWDELARAGLAGTTLPAAHGGAELGMTALGLVLTEAGRAAASLEGVAALVAATALGRLGTPAQAARLAEVVAGTASGTLALHEAGGGLIDGAGHRPATVAARVGDRLLLRGTKMMVPLGARTTWALVTAQLDGKAALLLATPTGSGVRREAGRATDNSTVQQLTFDDVPCELVGETAAVGWLGRRWAAALAAYELGIAARQLEMTAEHCLRRQQFGKPIGLFQAVGQRAADMHVDVESLRLAVQQALFALDDGARDAGEVAAAVDVAAFWAAEAGARVAAAAQHLHGGIGFDRGYPLYRYFLLAKRVELELGGADGRLAQLGARLAAAAPASTAAATPASPAVRS